MFEAYYDLLPPHWSFDEDTQLYFNDLTQEESMEHPIHIYMRARKDVLKLPGDDAISIEIERLQYEREAKYDVPDFRASAEDVEDNPEERSQTSPNADDSFSPFKIDVEDVPTPAPASDSLADVEKNSVAEADLPTGKFYEFHCQWTERDLFGKVNLYGITLRFYEEQQKTVIRFDGLVGEWVYSVLQGPYGPLEHIDFFIGAKITVFGRHLTISSASGSSIRWIERERKRLEKQEEAFREKILAVGKVPCVKGKQVNIVRHITRGSETVPGHTDLRKLLMFNARLGAQLASLGLSDQLNM